MSKKELREKLKQQAEYIERIKKALAQAETDSRLSHHELQGRIRHDPLTNSANQSPSGTRYQKDKAAKHRLAKLLKRAEEQAEETRQALMREGQG